jgi:hypothetical protein
MKSNHIALETQISSSDPDPKPKVPKEKNNSSNEKKTDEDRGNHDEDMDQYQDIDSAGKNSGDKDIIGTNKDSENSVDDNENIYK